MFHHEAAQLRFQLIGWLSSCDSACHPSRILALEKLGAVFNQVAFPLQYTPRKFVIHPETNNLILIESDHNAYTEATKAQRKQQMAEVCSAASVLEPSPPSADPLCVSATWLGDGGGCW